MKLKELLKLVGVQTTQPKWGNVYENGRNDWKMTGMVPGVSAHSADARMIINHMDDELHMYIRFGPIALFALRIPTTERYTFFIATTLSQGQYQINRYKWNKEVFDSMREMLEGPKPFEQHTTDEFRIFETLKLMSDKK